jgi:arabinose-5-phosphate isomerase
MNNILNIKNVIEKEANALLTLSDHIGGDYDDAINLLLSCKGKVVISGVGKSGHIGKKIAASLSSTGTPSFFVHSTEGVHGDLGMIQEKDIVILISNSGETTEVLSVIPSIKKIGSKIIAITSKGNSTLAEEADVVLTYQYDSEADPLNLAPTTSAMLTLVIGDALAVTLSTLKNFKKEDFHLYHPGGSLGKQLSSKN